MGYVATFQNEGPCTKFVLNRVDEVEKCGGSSSSGSSNSDNNSCCCCGVKGLLCLQQAFFCWTSDGCALLFAVTILYL